MRIGRIGVYFYKTYMILQLRLLELRIELFVALDHIFMRTYCIRDVTLLASVIPISECLFIDPRFTKPTAGVMRVMVLRMITLHSLS
jgi:hypothetical protein